MPTIQQIKAWVILHLEGRLDDDARQQLNDWIQASPANEQAVAEFMNEERLREGLKGLYLSRERIWQRLDAVVPDRQLPAAGRFVRMKWWAAAAVLILLGTTGSYFLFVRYPKPATITTPPIAVVPAGSNKALLTLADGTVVPLDSAASHLIQQGNTTVQLKKGQLQYVANGATAGDAWNKLSIPRGSQYQIGLPDGSRVWLNAASTLRYPLAFTGKYRRVELIGEAYFDIAPDSKQPFMIDIGTTAIQVLGTEFNVNAYPEETKLKATLVSGLISIKTTSTEQVIRPGKMAVVSSDGSCIVTTADVNAATAWKSGYFRFDDDDLPTLMRKLERWYDITVKYEGKIPERRFSGEIGLNTPLSDVLEFLNKTKIHYRKEGNAITIINQ